MGTNILCPSSSTICQDHCDGYKYIMSIIFDHLSRPLRWVQIYYVHHPQPFVKTIAMGTNILCPSSSTICQALCDGYKYIMSIILNHLSRPLRWVQIYYVHHPQPFVKPFAMGTNILCPSSSTICQDHCDGYKYIMSIILNHLSSPLRWVQIYYVHHPRSFVKTIAMGTNIFIHSFLWRPFKSSTTQRRSRLQHGYC